MRSALALLLLASAAGAQQSVTVPKPATTVTIIAKKDSLAVGDTVRDVTGAYLLRVQSVPTPPPVVIVPPPVITPPPVVTPPPNAHYFDDFSKYTSTAQITGATGRNAGYFWYAPSGHDMGGMSNPTRIFYDTSEKAMRYDWPNRSAVTSCTSEFTVAAMPRLNPLSVALPSGTRDLWVEFVSKESAGFSHGNPGCVRSYKFFLLQFERPANSTDPYSRVARAGLYLGDAAGNDTSTRAFMDISDWKGAYQYTNPQTNPIASIGGETSWGGAYHRWTMELKGIGTAAATFTVYLDGRKLSTLSSPFMNGETVPGGMVLYLEMGANMNNGPRKAQSRWFKELGVYTTKPAGIP